MSKTKSKTRSVSLTVAAFLLSTILLNGCVYSSTPQQSERYISPTVQGQEQRINLEAVEQAFFSTQGNDLTTWMSSFEKRVNEIYEGNEVISIDASRANNKLNVTGFVEKNNEPGHQNGEDKLFSIEQTGSVANNQMPYRVADERGQTYHQGQYNLLDNPFIQMLVLSQVLSAFGPRYYTPFPTIGTLRDYRSTYRNGPSYRNQRTANQQFNTRFRQRAGGEGLRSRTGFSQAPRTDRGQRRTFGNPSPYRSSPSMGGWGGRRSPMGGLGGRSWGGIRRR